MCQPCAAAHSLGTPAELCSAPQRCVFPTHLTLISTSSLFPHLTTPHLTSLLSPLRARIAELRCAACRFASPREGMCTSPHGSVRALTLRAPSTCGGGHPSGAFDSFHIKTIWLIRRQHLRD